MSSFENFVKCRVVSPVAATATDIALHEVVAPFNLPPEEGGILVLTDSPNNPSVIEVIRYGYRNALGLYDVQRGQEGTTAVAWTGPVYCYQSLMAGDFQALLDSKVDKAASQSLMTDAERTKLAGIAPGAQVNTVRSVTGKTGDVALAKGDVGLGNVDNMSDANKPVSTAQQTALNAKAPLASPVFTGSPKAPTPATSDSSTLLATTAFVQAAVAALVNGAPGALDQLNELAAAMGNDPNFAATMLNALALKAPLASPVLTGNPTAPTAAATDNDTSIATTAFVRAAMALFGVGSVEGMVKPSPDNIDDVSLAVGLSYRYDSSTSGTKPSTNGSYIVLRINGISCTQLAFDHASSSMYVRSYITGWLPWQKIWHDGNLVKQTSAIDTTAGALMEVGAFGLGAAAGPMVYDCNTATISGFYSVSGTAVNRPPRIGAANGGMLVLPGGVSSRCTQIYVYDSLAGPFMSVRHLTGGGWGPWGDLFHTGNILGTVSQSSGIPTGAIIERGSNANGEYVRFADGTQICWMSVTGIDISTAVGSIYRSVGVVAPHPASFVGTAHSYAQDHSSANVWASTNYGSTGVTVTLFYHAALTGRTARITSIGRWY